MNVIFSKEFKEYLKRIDNTLYITKYVIGTKYDDLMNAPSPENIRSLFSGDYLANDLRKTDKITLNSIIENNTLKLHLKILDKELLTEPSSSYDFIYIYGIYPDGNESIIMLLLNIIDNSFQPLDINITDNIVEINLPNDTEATIRTFKEEDTEFLEGIGILKGVNIYNTSDENLGLASVARDSYYKFIREKNTDSDSISFSYNNPYGERIFSKVFIDICEYINIYTIFSKDSEQKLSKDGGILKLLGVANFNRYKFINNYNSTTYIKNMNIDIISLPNTSIIVEDNTGINLDIDNKYNRIIYEKNTEGKELSVIIKFKYSGLDMSGNITSIFSNTIKLIQSNI